MKPSKTLLLLLVFLVFLFGPSCFLDGPVRISSGFSIKFPSIPAKITGLVLKPVSTAGYDSITVIENVPQADSLPVEFNTGFEPIQFTDSSNLFGKLIDSIFYSSGQTRIMYYGDSQLEGDRITDWLRRELRNYSGGTGPGLLSPTMLVPYTRSSYIRASANWKKYNYLSYHSGEINHRS
ncbi:MAG: hypothetical protein E4G95_01700, partial [Bacteroidia bacterium]